MTASSSYLDTINDLADEHDAAEVAAAILKLYAEETGRTTTPEQQEDDIATFAAAAPPSRGPRGETGMVRLFINVGRNQGARPQDFVGAIANEAGIPGRAIGAIDIFDDYAFVDIPHEFVDRGVGSDARREDQGAPRQRRDRPQRRRPRRARPGPETVVPARRPQVGGARVSRDGDDRPALRALGSTGAGRTAPLPLPPGELKGLRRALRRCLR